MLDLYNDHIIKANVGYTKYGNSLYNDLWYCDTKNKLCITFTPRGGCSIAFQQYLDLVGLLNDGLNYDSSHIHLYRGMVFVHQLNYIDINDLISDKYTFVKFIMNPYIRAVSIYRMYPHNLSFREYLKKHRNNTLDFNESYYYHSQLQYIDGEENIITKYVKIDKYEIFQITLSDGTLYNLDANKYTSPHHGDKHSNNCLFSGDLPKNEVYINLPKSHKYFYDDDIRQMVETIYKKDIEYYGYTFDDF